MPEDEPRPAMSDEQLDELLGQARWPEMPAQSMQRLAGRIDPPAQRREPVRPRRALAWAIAGSAAAAAFAGAAVLWLLLSNDAQQPIADGPAPAPEVIVTEELGPRFHTADLPGRAASDIELAWVQVIRRERQNDPQDSRSPNDSVAPRSQIVRAPGSRGAGLTPGVAARPPTAFETNRQLLQTVLDYSIDESKRIEAGRRLPAGAIQQALADPALAGRVPELLWALTISEDPAASGVLLTVAEMKPEPARRAIAEAPAGAAGVLGLVARINDPVIPRREMLARLVSASEDPAVYDALARRVSEPGVRREALMALLSSSSPEARALVARAESNPQLRAIVHSLRLQGIGPLRSNLSPRAVVL